MNKKLTHVGYVIGCNSTMPKDYKRKVLLRETKTTWVTEHGSKYRKDSGRISPRDVWAGLRLDLSSIKEITNE